MPCRQQHLPCNSLHQCSSTQTLVCYRGCRSNEHRQHLPGQVSTQLSLPLHNLCSLQLLHDVTLPYQQQPSLLRPWTRTFDCCRGLVLAGTLMHLQGFSVATPSGMPVVSNLDLRLDWGQHLLIEGSSGSGKSTLVRALRGLAPYSAETRQWPPPWQVCLLQALQLLFASRSPSA